MFVLFDKRLFERTIVVRKCIHHTTHHTNKRLHIRSFVYAYNIRTTHMRICATLCMQAIANDRTKGHTMANAKTYTPKQLANEIGIDAKVLRAYLRKNHTRPDAAKNTSWIIPATVAA